MSVPTPLFPTLALIGIFACPDLSSCSGPAPGPEPTVAPAPAEAKAPEPAANTTEFSVSADDKGMSLDVETKEGDKVRIEAGSKSE